MDDDGETKEGFTSCLVLLLVGDVFPLPGCNEVFWLINGDLDASMDDDGETKEGLTSCLDLLLVTDACPFTGCNNVFWLTNEDLDVLIEDDGETGERFTSCLVIQLLSDACQFTGCNKSLQQPKKKEEIKSGFNTKDKLKQLVKQIKYYYLSFTGSRTHDSSTEKRGTGVLITLQQLLVTKGNRLKEIKHVKLSVFTVY